LLRNHHGQQKPAKCLAWSFLGARRPCVGERLRARVPGIIPFRSRAPSREWPRFPGTRSRLEPGGQANRRCDNPEFHSIACGKIPHSARPATGRIRIRTTQAAGFAPKAKANRPKRGAAEYLPAQLVDWQARARRKTARDRTCRV